MHLLGEIDGLKPAGERALEFPRQGRRTTGDSRFEFCIGRGIAPTTGDGEGAISLHDLEQGITALISKHLADQTAQHVNVITQGRVLGRKLDIGTTHGGILHPQRIPKRTGPEGKPLRSCSLRHSEGVPVTADQRNE